MEHNFDSRRSGAGRRDQNNHKKSVKIVDDDTDEDLAPKKHRKDKKLNRKQKYTRTEGNITDLGALSDIGAANRFQR